jgi:hypothetical protein
MADPSPSPSTVHLPVVTQSPDPDATSNRQPRRRFHNFSPSDAANAELTWWFNEAESAIDQRSNFLGLLTGASLTCVEAVEQRAEAMHAARKIHDRLQRLRAADTRLLSGQSGL